MLASRFSLALLLLAPAAPAEGPPAPTLDDRLSAVKALIKGEKWKPALDGLRIVFEEFKGSPEVVRRLPSIEEDLKLCTYKAQEKPPTPEQIFGPGTRTYAYDTHVLVMEFPKGPATPPWEGTPPGSALLKVRFEDVYVDYVGTLAERMAVDLAYDPEPDTGYDLRPGTNAGQMHEQAGIVRLEGGTTTKKGRLLGSGLNLAGPGAHKVRFSLKSGELSIQVDGQPLVSAKDAKYPSGFVRVFGFREGSVSVRGKVDPKAMPDLLKACSERRFKEWAEKSWKREEAIPEWARQPPK